VSPTIPALLVEYDRARAYTDSLWRDLPATEVCWRPHEQSSAIGWHLGHQATVAHFMVRNLTAAEPSPDADLELLMDSATPEAVRGELPDLARLAGFRATVAERVHARVGNIASRAVTAPAQMQLIGATLLIAVINHEYQHDQWISEVRCRDLGRALPPRPVSDALCELDGYLVVGAHA
jgi:hypothetical protein